MTNCRKGYKNASGSWMANLSILFDRSLEINPTSATDAECIQQFHIFHRLNAINNSKGSKKGRLVFSTIFLFSISKLCNFGLHVSDSFSCLWQHLPSTLNIYHTL